MRVGCTGVYSAPRTPMARDDLGSCDPRAISFDLSVDLYTSLYYRATLACGILWVVTLSRCYAPSRNRSPTRPHSRIVFHNSGRLSRGGLLEVIAGGMSACVVGHIYNPMYVTAGYPKEILRPANCGNYVARSGGIDRSIRVVQYFRSPVFGSTCWYFRPSQSILLITLAQIVGDYDRFSSTSYIYTHSVFQTSW